MLSKLSIKSKLTLLAGVPVLGALALASLLWMHAQRGARSAAALGSVEDLAELSVGIASLVQELQSERALGAMVLGYHGRASDPLDEADDSAPEPAALKAAQQARLVEQRRATDEALTRFSRFLANKDLSALPGRLRRDLESSRETLNALSTQRAATDAGTLEINKNVEFFAKVDKDLIDATASLTQLSDDGELLRGISALVSVMQVKERASQEHALLASVFSLGKFPPGTYRAFVRLTTEEQVYIDVLRASAPDDDVALYDSSRQTAEAKLAATMRKQALENIEEEVDADAAAWFQAQAASVGALRNLEMRLSQDVRAAASTKLASIRESRQTSLGLSVGVLLLSTLLAGLIARGVAGSVAALTNAASSVQRDNDFSVRAVKTTDDELGQLTVAFNEMLGGIQARDRELDEYRRDLESKVESRTRELSERNAAMRLVLDNVDQGLATIRTDGTLAKERSAAFDRWFGKPAPGVHFGNHVAADNREAASLLTLSWGEVVEGFFPLELTIGQMPAQLEVHGRHYTLNYKPILGDGQLQGALLIVTDVTEELARRLRESEQAESIAVFERFMKDRAGFIEFFNEGQRLLNQLTRAECDRAELRHNLHTLKGNCAIYSVSSVASACHEAETALDDDGAVELDAVRAAWAKFAVKARGLIGGHAQNVFVLEERELDDLLEAVRARRPYLQLERELNRLRFEPVAARFFRVGEQAKRLAQKLGKLEPEVIAKPNDVRLPAQDWCDFWSAFTHVVRNAVDHGLETEAARTAAGKPATGSLTLEAHASADSVEIEVHDDGRGVDWERIRQRARARGLPVETHEHLVAALFSDHISSREDATEVSGRGVGMGAVLAATRRMGGTIDVHSSPGAGTSFVFKFPKLSAAALDLRSVGSSGGY